MANAEYLPTEEEGRMAARRAAAGLPCLNSNNCITDRLDKRIKWASHHKRARFVLEEETRRLCVEYGIERIGFLTLTFKENLIDNKEASRRLHSLRTNVLKGRYVRGAWVRERQVRGAVHFHLVVVLLGDIRSGVDFAAFADTALPRRRRYASAPALLKSEWAFWRATAKNYGFGRTELLPVKSNKDGIVKYLGTYIGKDFQNRIDKDRGARFYGFWGYEAGDRMFKPGFMVNGEHERLWRLKLRKFCLTNGFAAKTVLTVLAQKARGPKTKEDTDHWVQLDRFRAEVVHPKFPVATMVLTKTLHGATEILEHFWGKRWAWRLRNDILDVQLSPEELATFTLPIVMQERERQEIIDSEKYRCCSSLRRVTSIDKENYI